MAWKIESRSSRERKSLSQGKLAELCKVTRQTINAIENNKYDPSLELAFALSNILGFSDPRNYLFLNTKVMEKSDNYKKG